MIEGRREIGLALKAGIEIETFFYHPGILPENEKNVVAETSMKTEWIEVSAEVYDKLAYRGSTEGLLAIAKSRNHGLEDLQFQTSNPLILVAEAPEKPGNIGALLRTADAAHLDAVIIANPKTDLFNPNIIRSSVGCVFTNQIALGNTDDIIRFLQNRQIPIYCAALQASVNYATCDFRQAAAIIVGTEANGLSQTWLNSSTQNILIPMGGEIDSMNVSVAAGILIFEAKRQRDFK